MSKRLTSNRRQWLSAVLTAAWPWPVLAADAQRQAWSRPQLKPALQLLLLDGSMWRLIEQRGAPVLLNFWASWCEPCRSEMPSLQALSDQRVAQGLQVLAVNYRETTAAVRRFMDSTSLRLPVLQDPDGAAAKVCGVHTFPSTLAIDRHGRVRFLVVGECDWMGAAASRWVDELLSY